MKLFVSYRSTDSAKVDPIVYRLRSLKYTVWQDKDCIPVGQDWWEAICEGIRTSDVFLFMLSQESVKSFACLAELSYAHELNMPIIPFVIEGEWTYNAGGKYDIAFWSDVPQELQDSRAQLLFYEGVGFVDKLKAGMDVLLAKKLPRFPATPPPDPRHATDATNNVTVIYDEAYDFAYRGEFDHAKKLFRKLVNYNDAVFWAIALEWVHLLDEYTRIKAMAERTSTRKLAQTQWNTYTQKFPKDFLEGVFDPANVPKLFISREHTLPPAPKQPRSADLLPAPFAWVEIPSGNGKMKTDESVMLDIPTQRYWISKYPVTNAQFAKFIEAGGYKQRKWWTEAGWAQREKDKWTEPRFWTDNTWNGIAQPVVGVSWYEAVAFCLWLSGATGDKIMLPTEAQWQYASQGTDERAYPWGKDWDANRCNTGESGISKTTSVTAYEGKGDSPFGVVDMAGNVWEWCLTDYETGTNDSNISANMHILRGGSWNNYSTDYFQCGYRYWLNPNYRHYNIGFRLALS